MIALIMWQNGANIGHFLVLDGFYKGTNGTDYITYMNLGMVIIIIIISVRSITIIIFGGVKLFIISMQTNNIKSGFINGKTT